MSEKTLGQIAFEAAQDEWNGWDTWDHGRDEWHGEDEMSKAMWEAAARAVVNHITCEGGGVMVERARLERLINHVKGSGPDWWWEPTKFGLKEGDFDLPPREPSSS